MKYVCNKLINNMSINKLSKNISVSENISSNNSKVIDIIHKSKIIHATDVFDMIHEANITSLSDLYNIFLCRHLESNNVDGQIYCVYNVAFQIYGPNICKVGFSDNIKKQFKLYSKLYLDPMEVVYLSEKLPYYNLIGSVIFQKLAKYKLVPDRNFYQCDKALIKSTIEETINEFESLSLLDLANEYDFNDIMVINFKNTWFNFIKALITNKPCANCNDFDNCGYCGEHKGCDKCKNYYEINSIELDDICNPHKILNISECCNEFYITNAIIADPQIQIMI